MSHFTTVKTVIRDQAVLAQTLRQLHHQFKEGERLAIRGYQEQNAYGQVVVDTGCEYDIGFQKQSDQGFAVCADWWGVENNTGIREKNFLQQVNQTYSHLMVKKQVLEQGYLIEEEKVMENGEIELLVSEPI